MYNKQRTKHKTNVKEYIIYRKLHIVQNLDPFFSEQLKFWQQKSSINDMPNGGKWTKKQLIFS